MIFLDTHRTASSIFRFVFSALWQNSSQDADNKVSSVSQRVIGVHTSEHDWMDGSPRQLTKTAKEASATEDSDGEISFHKYINFPNLKA